MTLPVSVDDREPEALVALFRAHPDTAEVEVRRLDAGDIVIGDIGFERKTSADYLRSALGRFGTNLEKQVRKMNEMHAHGYVLIEGNLSDIEEGWPGVANASVRGSIASIIARLGVPVIPCGDRERLVDMAIRLACKHTEEPSLRPLSASAVTRRDEPTVKRMYACIDGIGPGTAETLYEAYPTVELLLAATKEDLLSIDGVGPKRAGSIYAALRSDS